MAVTETITHDFDKVVTRLLERSRDYTVPLKRFYVYLHGETVKLFPILGKKGGATYRGMQWKWFADQYIRKHPKPGQKKIMPAEGIPGEVLGRLRHSGKRIKSNDLMMSDSGIMRKAALGSFQVSTHEIVMSTPVNYAKYQNAMRPFMFLTPEDVDKVRQYIIEYLIEG